MKHGLESIIGHFDQNMHKQEALSFLGSQLTWGIEVVDK